VRRAAGAQQWAVEVGCDTGPIFLLGFPLHLVLRSCPLALRYYRRNSPGGLPMFSELRRSTATVRAKTECRVSLQRRSGRGLGVTCC
jgi:hypothetical protein